VIRVLGVGGVEAGEGALEPLAVGDRRCLTARKGAFFKTGYRLKT
jgi:hypothetical protein